MRIDADRPQRGLFDRDQGYSGQEYNRADAEQQLRKDPSGAVDLDAADFGHSIEAEPDAPPESRQRASLDPATGEVRRSGSGDGGGKIRED